MTYKKIKNCDYSFPNINVPEEVKDFIKKILVLDPKQRMTVREMFEHPFLKNEDVPPCIPVEALTTIPNFKTNGKSDENQTLNRLTSPEKTTHNTMVEDFWKKLNINPNKPANNDGMFSPRNAFNSELTNREKSSKLSTGNREEEHKIHVLTYVDYSKKYGLGYLINNNQYGVYFNDETLISTDLETKKVYFIDNPAGKEEKISSYTSDSIPKDRDFQKKYMLLERFITHLNDEASKLSEEKLIYFKNEEFIYMKQWLKTRHAIMFGMSNKIFQVNFFDNSQIILNTEKKTVLFHSKKGDVIYDTLSNALQASDSEMARRIKYTK